MKITTRRSIITVLLAVLLISLICVPVLAQTPDDQEVPRPLSVDEELEKWGVANPDSPLIAPREQWPEIPSLVHPDFISKEAEASRDLVIYRAGIKTDSEETWAGYKVTICGDSIANDDPDDKNVYLAPHLVLKDASDYLAVVLKKTDDDDTLELWTIHYIDLFKWNYHTTISQSSYYDFLTIIRTNDDFQIYYRTHPNGNWIQLRSGDMGSQESSVEFFLEHQVPVGDSPGEHGYSYWEEMTLYDLDEDGYWWTQTPTVIGPDYPLDQYNWLVSGYDRHMRTRSDY